MNEELAYQFLTVVSEIPPGCVASYGQVARLAGRPRNARLVGLLLHRADLYGVYPCHRVVNRDGRLAPGWAQQAVLLEQEGVDVKDGYVDMRRFQWKM